MPFLQVVGVWCVDTRDVMLTNDLGAAASDSDSEFDSEFDDSESDSESDSEFDSDGSDSVPKKKMKV